MDAEDARTIGQRLRQIRYARRKSLRVVAGLAGISRSHLSRIERGERALDSLSEIVALANALQIAPSELMRLPVPAPANGDIDSTTEAIGLALDAIEVDHPGGLVLPVAVLRDRVARFHQQKRACRFADVAAELPGLVRDLHTTLATGADHGELLKLAVYLHVHVTRQWLIHANAPADLLRRVVFLARRLAQERGEATTLGMAGFAVADTLLAGGEFELGKAELDSLTLPPTTAATAGLVGVLTTSHAAAAALNGRPGDATAAMDAAADMAGRFGELGETDPLGFEFGPTNVGFRRVRLALEAGEPDRAVSIAEGLHPNQNPFPCNRVYHWVGYGRALARLRGRRDDAVRALRRAETLYPLRVQRDPFVREVLGELVIRSRRDAIGRELRGMAYRAGLPE
ncbi:MAG: helix-turn-helix domain-containing protein [Actinomycetota bacterium]|nr:helix-turn-helix domain-containing protein [Actinomycetota bacterium]